MTEMLFMYYPSGTNLLIENFIVFLRISTIVFLLPGTGENYVSNRIKLGFAFCMTLAVNSSISASPGALEFEFEYPLSIITSEIIVGMLISLPIRFGIYSLHIFGAIASQSSSIAQIFGATVSNDAQPTIGNILTISGISLLIMHGIHVDFLIITIRSYETFQPGEMVNSTDLLRTGINIMAKSFLVGVQLSLPFLALSLFYNVTLGVINRAMPQLPVSLVGAPAIIAASIGLLVISSNVILSTWIDLFGYPRTYLGT